jgi:hypothetical protein
MMSGTEPVGPETDRPRMFGRVGLEPVLLPWSWAEHRLVRARGYWIASTRPDGRPHTRPVWGVWHEGAFYFSTGSLAAANVAHDPRITLHLESGAEVVILEGNATATTDQDLVSLLSVIYNDKYRWDLDPDAPATWYEVRPEVAFGWIVDDSGRDYGATFHGTATRWRFAPGSTG